MQMSDPEFDLYRARQSAAGVYRSHGFEDFADRVSAGLEDDCSQMRIAKFFIAPPREHSPEYLAEWRSLEATASGMRARNGTTGG